MFPTATYRLQLRGGVGFREAAELVPYLAALGVSHVYCSPYVEARAGSTHGYDVVDPRRLDPALGSEEDFDAFVAALRRHGMGQILDWVPNHVGIAQGHNSWWQELLAFGPASPYADFFDVDWTPGRQKLRGKVLLPVLGDLYGDVLERGELVPERESTGGLCIRYFEQAFPVSPPSWGRLLSKRLLGPGQEDVSERHREELRRTLAALTSRAGRRDVRVKRVRDAQQELGRLLDAEPALHREVERLVAELRGEPGRPASFDALHRLLEVQHYRLAYWRVAAEEINYRRFFDINELAALRMERPEVFAHVHERLFAWIEDGRIDGLRIDHVDGMADPEGYCARIRQRFPRERLHLVVEKILGADERLPSSWPVDGTTGYEFLNLVNGLFVDAKGERPLDRLYRSFTGEVQDFEAILRASKHRIMRALLASELEGLASALDRLAQSDRHTRDFTLGSLRAALRDVVAAFPVYRSYVRPEGTTDEDRSLIERAVGEARGRAEDPESGVFEWIESVLTGDLARAERSAARRRELLRFVTRFQQYTAPAMAKGLEDTSFYRYHRLVSLNEVGGDPRRFGVDSELFHAENRERASRHPRALLTTSTHDTKRGEDARARIDVLSERPAEWARAVRDWARVNRRLRRRVAGGPAPTPKDEYLIYQVLLGSLPAEASESGGFEAHTERVQGYLVKALREGKERSSWRFPDVAYEEAVGAFVGDLLAPGSPFLEAFLPFHREVAERGALNGLAQLVLKLAAPGVPDVYQGCESWDLSLADPDNRRPVDFQTRRATLEALGDLVGRDGEIDAARLCELRESWRDGRIKQWLTWRLLRLRRRQPGLFDGAGYVPLATTGDRADNLCAFARASAAGPLLVAVPRLCAALPRGSGAFPLGRRAWGETRVELAEGLGAPIWRDVLCGARIQGRAPAGERGLEVAHLFETLPVAVLVRDEA
ncbi:MAG: malto-oligosyltrehalose synthase [Myxococcota bacterium]|nr:malto-oligosyltrehalose synthase [Myxococcota bacterium]